MVVSGRHGGVVVAKKVFPKDFAMMILPKFMCGRLPGKRIVCSASKVTTCSSVYQTCQVVANSMLHQQGDNTVIIYQSYHAHGVHHGRIMSCSWHPPRPPSETTSLALASSRSAAAAFFARMYVRSAATGGRDDGGGGDVVALAATRADQ